MADNNNVTIDAAWFAELYDRAKTTACETCLFRVKHDDMKICQDMIVEARDNLRRIVRKMDSDFSEVEKERDALKKELDEHLKNCRNRNCWLNAEYKALEKERDALKAALERANQTNSAQADQLRDALNENEMLKAKLAAAERCIEDIEAAIFEYETESQGSAVLKVIRAYREKKEAAR